MKQTSSKFHSSEGYPIHPLTLLVRTLFIVLIILAVVTFISNLCEQANAYFSKPQITSQKQSY